jgi:hypothetical protein
MKPGFDFYREDVIAAHYCFCVLHHEGQGSELYARLSRMQRYYKPGLSGNDNPDNLDYAQQEIYRNLCAKHNVPCDITEDKIARLEEQGYILCKFYDYWASALINGDESGMDDKDIRKMNAALEWAEVGHCVDVWDDGEFGEPDHSSIRGNVCTYVFEPKGGLPAAAAAAGDA